MNHAFQVVTLLAAMAAGSVDQVPGVLQEDLGKAQGAWNVVRYKRAGTGWGRLDGNGNPLGPRVIVRWDKIWFVYPDHPRGGKSDYQVRSIDQSTTPKQVDLTLKKDGKTILRKGIYVLKTNTLQCEFADPGQPRPANFGATNHFTNPTDFFIFKRFKPK